MTQLVHAQYGSVLLMVAILAALGFAIVALIGLVRRPAADTYRGVWLKYAVHITIMSFLVSIGAFGRWALLPVVCYVGYFGWQELLSAVERRLGHIRDGRWLPLIGLAGIPFGMGQHAWDLLIGLILTAWLALLVPMLQTQRPPGLPTILTAGLGSMLITLPLSMLLFVEISYPLFAFLVVVLMAHDGFCEGMGRLGGKRAIWPHISPNKTYVGSIGGLVCGTLVAIGLAPLLPHTPVWQVGLLATLMALVGSMGDLIASSIKREAGIKDFSALIPYHGGILDRFDSLLFATPVFLAVTRWLGV